MRLAVLMFIVVFAGAYSNNLKQRRLTKEYKMLEETKVLKKKQVEVFSAGCSICRETIELVRRLASVSHDVVIHDMLSPEVAAKAKAYGVQSLPAVVIDGNLAGCCAGLGPDEHTLRAALAG